jgi:oligopeptidase B
MFSTLKTKIRFTTMRKSHLFLSIALLSHTLLYIACKTDAPKRAEGLTPPVAAKQPKVFTEFGQQRVDDYHWLNNGKDSNVVNHLKAENAYCQKMLAHTEGLQKTLYDEMVSRVEQVSQDVPVKTGGYWFYRRFEQGKEYPLICRKKETWAANEEVILDVPTLSKGYKLYRLFEYSLSPDGNLLAYNVDTAGDRRNTLFIKDLRTGQLLPETMHDVANGGLVWSNDGKYLFYCLNDPSVRSYKILRHALGSDPKTDPSVFEEKDITFQAGVFKSESKQYIMVSSSSTTTSETRFMDANTPLSNFKMVQPRQRDLEYYANHYEGDSLHIYSNANGAKNYKVSVAPIAKSGLANWKDVIPHSDSSFLQRYVVLKNYILIQDKVRGLNKIRILDRKTNQMEDVDFGEEVYVANMYMGDEDDFNSDSLRYNYQSLTTPSSTFRYDIKTKVKTILKQDKVAGYNVSQYETKRLWVKARDGVAVPLSMVYKKEAMRRDGSNPLLLYSYGSYGINSEPYFNQTVVSLMDRGFVYVIAHIRGGQELGRKWYDDGKLKNKKNTFNDFVDAAEYLIAEKYTQSDRLFGNGGSAGGMLMGAVINQKPSLWRGIVAEVPWVDVISDLYDETLPLTSLEWDEWGDPRKAEFYDYIRSWSPYDNIKKENFPAILATGGLNDTQVTFYNPTKWVQRLRENNTGQNPILFKCDLDAGHAGQSGRFERYKKTALKYAFILDLVGQSK